MKKLTVMQFYEGLIETKLDYGSERLVQALSHIEVQVNSAVKSAFSEIFACCNALLANPVKVEGNAVVILDQIKIRSVENDTDMPVVVEVMHYGKWTKAKSISWPLYYINVQMNQIEPKKYIASYKKMVLSVIQFGLKYYFYKENKEGLSRAVINRSLAAKEKEGIIVDTSLYEFKDQEFLIKTTADLLFEFFSAKYAVDGTDIADLARNLSHSIRDGIRTILNPDMTRIMDELNHPMILSLYLQHYIYKFKNLSAYLKWEHDSKQRMTFAYFNGHVEKDVNNEDYFKYENLLNPNNPFNFENKRCVRRTLQADIQIIRHLMEPSSHNFENAEGFFGLWTTWLGYTKTQNVNPDIFEVLTKIKAHVPYRPTRAEHRKIAHKHLVHLFDLLYNYLQLVFEYLDKVQDGKKIFKETIDFNEFTISIPSSKSLEEYCESVNSLLGRLRDYLFHIDDINLYEDYQFPNITWITSKTTLKSLARHSEEWHWEIFKKEKGPYVRWHFLKEFCIDFEGYTFTLITNSDDLHQEGLEQNHCILTYKPDIEQGSYLAFKIEGKGERATVGYHLIQQPDHTYTLEINQVKGYRNDYVPVELTHSCLRLMLELKEHIDWIIDIDHMPVAGKVA